jgi:peptidoglycan/LPS O-acetylase OafA/YrhL
MGKGARANSFDAIRLCAAIAVLVFHAYVVLGRSGLSLGDESLGGAAVLVFFGISGYLITQSWVADPHLARFALKRVLRIYPALIVVVLLTVFVLGPLVTTTSLEHYAGSFETWRYLGMNVVCIHSRFLLPGVFLHNHWRLVNRSIWTLSGELFGYAAIAVLGVAGAFRRRWVAVPALILVAWLSARIPASVSVINYTWIRAFAVGSILFLFKDAVPRRLWICGLLLAAFLLASVRHDFNTATDLAVIGLPYCAVVVAHAFPNLLKPITRRGDFSYGMYLYGWPVEQVMILLLGRAAGVPELLLLAFLATSSLAVASWFLVEKPALGAKRRLAARKASTVPPQPALAGP